MAVRRYTREELLRLRESPLVQKPDNLPAIEQWLEYVFLDKDSLEKLRIPHSESQQQAQGAGTRRQPQAKTGGDASPMGNFSAGSRPGLTPARSMGGSKSGDDISLGPPRTMFPSSRNVPKLSDFSEKMSGAAGEGTAGEEHETPRSRFFADKQSNRKSMHEKEGRDNRESWTSIREKRALAGDDEHRSEGRERYGRRDRDHDGERRNGYGEKHDSRWGERRQNGDRTNGWRERERERKERDWDRGGHAEKEPEWMDDPAPPGGDGGLGSMGIARNQEQFQKWKEAMSGKKAQSEETERVVVEPEPEPEPRAKESAPAKTPAPLQLEGIVDKPFGGWVGENKSAAHQLEGGPAPAKSAPTKSKGSRFASMFKETQAIQELPPSDTTVQKAAETVATNAAEDKAGFDRILQMLGSTGVGQPTPLAVSENPASPPPKAIANGPKPKSRFTGFFDQTPKSPERMISPPQAPFAPRDIDQYQGRRGLAENPPNVTGGMRQELPGDQPVGVRASVNPISPEPIPASDGQRERGPPPGRGNDMFMEQPPPRGVGTPDVNIQNLLASQRAQRAQGQDKNSAFLLDLLQTKGSRPPSQQARPESFPLWLDQPPDQPEPHAPKPRAPPPPGLFEDQLLRNTPTEPARQEQAMPVNEMPQRRTSQRAPPGFFDEQNLYLQQQQQAQRRTFPDAPLQGHPHAHHPHQPPRRMSAHPQPPPMQIPGQHQSFAGPPPDFLQSPGGHPQAPPPGFNPHMARHPPGIHNIPNIFQPPQLQPLAQQQQQQLPPPPPPTQAGPRGEPPPGFGGGGHAGAGMMVVSPTSPPNAPPGFFGGGPPGMPPGMPPGFIQQMRAPQGPPFEGMGGGGVPRR